MGFPPQSTEECTIKFDQTLANRSPYAAAYVSDVAALFQACLNAIRIVCREDIVRYAKYTPRCKGKWLLGINAHSLTVHLASTERTSKYFQSVEEFINENDAVLVLAYLPSIMTEVKDFDALWQSMSSIRKEVLDTLDTEFAGKSGVVNLDSAGFNRTYREIE